MTEAPTPAGSGVCLREAALIALLEADPSRKAQAAQDLFKRAQRDTDDTAAPADAAQGLPDATRAQALRERHPGALPGRPAQPTLVSAKEVPTRSPFTLEGRAALLHAICHIEFNAINLALDAVWRFDDMPAGYYLDWLRVASEEALHFGLLQAHLQGMGWGYGAFQAHDGLWAMCERTSQDILARMALVPRTLEARGLDATPPIQAKLRKAGDEAAVAILDTILRDEVGHVAIGNRWFHHLCQQRGLDAVATYQSLVVQHEAPRLKPPYNVQARKRAGFTDEEMRYLLGEMG